MIRPLFLAFALTACAQTTPTSEAATDAYNLADANEDRIIALEERVTDLEASNEYLEGQIRRLISLQDTQNESLDRLFRNDETYRQSVNMLLGFHGQPPHRKADE